jgi:DNA invertase Pin-like site-specific DNA recombinase
MKAVIYARYSSDSQTENSIEGQLRECKDFAERNGMMVFSTYIDRAFSAKTDNRPEFQRMVKDSAKNLFDIIIVWKLDRFARNRYDSAHYKAVLRKNKVKVVSATEPISQDSTGILLESLLEGYAEFFSAELSEKVKRGLTENALKCKWNGGGIPVGYYVDDERHMQIDSLTAPFVLETFKRYAEGEKTADIARWLAKSGVKTYLGNLITFNSTQRMLKNRAYMGDYCFGKHVIPGGVPAIVPAELFNRVQEQIAKNKKAPARRKAEDEYLLTTKLLCGKCGAYMVGESGRSSTSKKHRYYKCVSVKYHKGCDKKTVKRDWIEDLIVSQALTMLADNVIIKNVADMVLTLQKQENVTLPMLRKQLAETERGIQNMLNAIQQGVLNQSTKQRLDELEAAKSDIEVRVLQEELQKPLLTREQILFFLHKFRNIDTTKQEQRQHLIDIFVNAIYLYDDKLVLTFNYKDGAKTITADEIKGFIKSVSSDLTTGCVEKG